MFGVQQVLNVLHSDVCHVRRDEICRDIYGTCAERRVLCNPVNHECPLIKEIVSLDFFCDFWVDNS